MRERTVKIGSAGKIFALTGWKVGWMCAGPALARGLAKAHQFLTFTTPPNLQWAVAEGLATQDGWVQEARRGFQRGARPAEGRAGGGGAGHACRARRPISCRSISPPRGWRWTTSPSATG
ncbi:MAG: aminotransferase class I/II-fold pyridoxal phosphate-dependent enzyme [Sphingomonas sp.]